MFKTHLMPKSINCYICGRGYGTRSLKFHLKTCQKKWKIQEDKKPRHLRKPVPQAPSGFLELIQQKKITRKDLQNYNKKAYEFFDQNVLDKCNFCNRTFNPKAFKIHKKLCSKEKPFKPLNRNQNKVIQSRRNKTQDLNHKIKIQRNITREKKVSMKEQGVQADINYHSKRKFSGVKMKTGYKMKSKNNIQQIQRNINDQNGKGQNNKNDQYKQDYRKEQGQQKREQVQFEKQQQRNQGQKIVNKNVKINNLKKKRNQYKKIEKQSLFSEQKQNSNLIACSKCNRTFNNDRIDKHESICKTMKKIRKKDIKVFHKIPKKINKPKSNWKQQSEQIQLAMKNVRAYEKAKKEGKPIPKLVMPKQQQNSNLIQCKHCQRTFNHTAHKRHEPKCKNIRNKPKFLKRK